MFPRIAFAAALAGLASGLLLSAMQQAEIIPLIRQAEALQHGAPAQAPSIFATVAANVVLATGFALLVAAAMSLRATGGWRRGLLWGVAGYAVFFVAPSLGLPPELPGVEAAPLPARQWWWLATIALTATGLWLAAFARSAALRWLGLGLLLVPHVIGAPAPAIEGGTAPVELARDFARASYLANGIFWLALGGLAGLFYGRRFPVNGSRPRW